jgi:polysaccharide pyruvyl transferase WcaK-like protein
MKETATPPEKIALFQHAGYGNLGDDAGIAAVIQNITSRWAGAEIIALSLNPCDTRTRHGIPTYPIRSLSKSPPGLGKAGPGKAGAMARIRTRLGKHRFLTRLLRAANRLAIRMPRALFQEVIFLAQSFRIMRSVDLFIVCGGGQIRDS